MKHNITKLENMAHTIDRNAKNFEARERVVLVQKKLFKDSINVIASHRIVIAMGKIILVKY